MKKIGACLSCGREVYTNDLNLCKRCHKDADAEFLKTLEQK